MSQNLHQNLHQKLVQLHIRASEWLDTGRAGGFMPVCGICAHLTLSEGDETLLADLMASWPGGSGVKNYPVPHPDKDPEYAYGSATMQEMWDPEYEYARNRLALLDWLIEQTDPTRLPYVVVVGPGTDDEVEIGTFATFLEAVAFASKNRDGHDVDVMKRQPDGSLTTEL